MLLTASSWASTGEREADVTGDGLGDLGGEQGQASVPVLGQTLQQAQIQRAAHLGWPLQGGEPGLVAVTPAASAGSSPAPGQCGAAPLSQSSRVGADELGCLWGLSSRACFASFLGPGVGP